MDTPNKENDIIIPAKVEKVRDSAYWTKYYKDHKGATKHCEHCDIPVDKFNFSRHCKTKKHLSNMTNTKRETEMQATIKKLVKEELEKLNQKPI